MKIKRQKNNRQRKLHIGGIIPRTGWEILNAVPGEHIKHVCDATDLSMFQGNTFFKIYSSHVLEHFDYKKVLDVLQEWKRVLKPRGKIYISVPDLDNLCRMFLFPDLTLTERYHVMRMMFGGHMDKYDYHLQGLNFELLNNFLGGAGFINIQKVTKFDVDFQDTSNMLFHDIPVSVNVIAEKPICAI